MRPPRSYVSKAHDINPLSPSSALGPRGFEEASSGGNPICIPLDPILRDTTPHPSDVCSEGASGPGAVRLLYAHLQGCRETMHRYHGVIVGRDENPISLLFAHREVLNLVLLCGCLTFFIVSEICVSINIIPSTCVLEGKGDRL